MNNNNAKPKVLLVGTFHMEAKNDLHNADMDNMLSHKRQEEICEVVERLKGFKPTKVALEIETKYDEVINNKYKDYVDGKHELSPNETQQLGFRIAKDLGHEKLHCIDWMERGAAERPLSDVCDWAKKNQPELFKETFEESYSPLDKNSTILDMYREVNDEYRIRKNHECYVNMARIGEESEYVGIGWLIWWYQRNLILFSNLCRLAVSNEDRVLLIIGSAHVYLLEQLLRDSGMVEVVNVNEFLGED